MAWPRLWPSRERTELKRLRESEARYRLLAEHVRDIRDVIVQYDPNGLIQYASPSVAIMGYTPEEVVGRNILDFAHSEEVDFSTRRLGALRDGVDLPRGPENEIRLRCRDGSWRWLQGNPAPMLDGEGQPVGIVTILRDISERRELEERLLAKQAEAEQALEQLRTSEARYRLVADHIGDLVLQYDTEGVIQFASPSVARLGYRPEDLEGRHIVEFGHPDSIEPMRMRLELLKAGQSLPRGSAHELQVRRADGSFVWMQGNPTPVHDAEGRPLGAVSLLRDVTERRALEEQLRESEFRYRLLADASPDIIIRYNVDGIIEYISPAVRRYGATPESLIGRNAADLIDRNALERNDDFMADLAAGRPLPQGDRNVWRTPLAGGRWAEFEGATNPIVDEGRVIGAISVLRDVTERVALEEELRRRKEEAEAAVIAKSEFLANMSHEIRTPLTAVVGFAGLLAKMAGLPDRARTYVDRIGKSGEALTAIVNNVLDLSKVEAGQVVLKSEPFELHALADEALGVVQEAATAKGLTLTVKVPDDPRGQLLGDGGRLRQVLLNLLTNAIKFTHQGGVTVELGYDRPAGRLHVAVRDTGIGIAPEYASRLFQRFSQVESSNARRFGGAGLGLAISRGLVELMGGEIGVESLEGAGSTFWFAVPAPVARAPARPVEPEPPSPMAGARILVVDDARANRELIAALLGPFSPHLTEAADGLEALEATRRDPFDLVLMDLQMPGMDGMAATRAIRSGGELNRGTPILAVSASVQPSDVEACRQAGMDDHIPKPINARELLGKVARWTGGGPGSGAMTG